MTNIESICEMIKTMLPEAKLDMPKGAIDDLVVSYKGVKAALPCLKGQPTEDVSFYVDAANELKRKAHAKTVA